MKFRFALPALALATLAGCSNYVDPVPNGTSVTVSLLETSDIHQNVLGYNYYSLSADATVGMDRAATLIKAARAENPEALSTILGTNSREAGNFSVAARPTSARHNFILYGIGGQHRHVAQIQLSH
jgi:hypothetical protein